jgi:hypothetical protein
MTQIPIYFCAVCVFCSGFFVTTFLLAGLAPVFFATILPVVFLVTGFTAGFADVFATAGFVFAAAGFVFAAAGFGLFAVGLATTGFTTDGFVVAAGFVFVATGFVLEAEDLTTSGFVLAAAGLVLTGFSKGFF